MKYRNSAGRMAAWLVAALVAGGAAAQTRTAPATMTDVAPLPAEDRASTGAVVLDQSLQRAQRGNGFAESANRTGVGGVGRGDVRARLRAQREADLADARAAETFRVLERGAKRTDRTP